LSASKILVHTTPTFEVETIHGESLQTFLFDIN